MRVGRFSGKSPGRRGVLGGLSVGRRGSSVRSSVLFVTCRVMVDFRLVCCSIESRYLGLLCYDPVPFLSVMMSSKHNQCRS
jgi:hypothetical protein